VTAKLRKIEEIDCAEFTSVPADVLSSSRPIVLRNLISHWPSVGAAGNGNHSVAKYLQQFDKNIPLTVYRGAPEADGRVFYNDDMTGFNFERLSMPMRKVIEALFSSSDNESKTASYYVGSTMLDHWLPGFRKDNDLGLEEFEPLVSLWFGNRSKIAAHYDFPNNIACNVAGKRRFTLFPPNQADNLYVGPIDFTPSGPAISLVDTSNPDFEKFPKYKAAAKASLSTELEAGDAIFIPSMWWHHVQAIESFNVLVNYWWRSTPAYLGSPANALQHSVMALHGLPAEQKHVWKDIFNRYVFSDEDQSFDHIPEHARGVLSKVDIEMAKSIRARLVRFLK
jgi:hypothetical protein